MRNTLNSDRLNSVPCYSYDQELHIYMCLNIPQKRAVLRHDFTNSTAWFHLSQEIANLAYSNDACTCMFTCNKYRKLWKNLEGETQNWYGQKWRIWLLTWKSCFIGDNCFTFWVIYEIIPFNLTLNDQT
jgi:hypothetical protein